MDILHVIVGLFLIGLGFLVKSSPDLIAGYNTMPEEKKKNVDIDGLSTYMRNAMVAMGMSIPLSAIDAVHLAGHIPAIKARTNGYSFGATKKGFFNLDEWGRTRLLVHSDQPRYVIISTSDGSKMVFNFKETAATEAKYQRIKALLEEYKAESLP